MISEMAVRGIETVRGFEKEERKPIRTLIVDDSSSMRRLIRHSLAGSADIEVVAEAENARAARDAVNKYRPDVMTLDVEMPEMDGLEFLRRLMKARPMPVVMVSSLTERGSDAAIRALSLGAVECVAKPKGLNGNAMPFEGLDVVLRMAASARVRPRTARAISTQGIAEPFQWNGKYVLIGASTGGVEALETLLSDFPENCPPTLITQHMPAQFLINFAARLNKKCAPEIQLARDGQAVEQGCVYIAPGGETHLTLSTAGRPNLLLQPGPRQTGHRPSVDVMFASARVHAANVIGVLLTGMGADGAEGLRVLRENGAFCIGQDRQSSVVYGMPRVACEKDAIDMSLHLSKIAGEILSRTASSGAPVQPANRLG